jgi:uncharacterized coiled-coil protein SlyX
MIAAILIFTFFNSKKEKILIDKITELENKYSISQTTIEHLRKKIAEIEQVLQSVPFSPDLKMNSMEDPVSHIRKDLIKRSDVIPYAGVLGGTMGFYDENRIHILNHKWVYAHFEDGHIGGEMLLEYDISEDGKINWKVITSFP